MKRTCVLAAALGLTLSLASCGTSGSVTPTPTPVPEPVITPAPDVVARGNDPLTYDAGRVMEGMDNGLRAMDNR